MSLKGTVEFKSFANTASLPSAANGAVAWVTDQQSLYVYKQATGWVPLVAKKGSISNPALSPAQIIADGGDSSGDGIYYYTINNTTTPIYTNFTINDPVQGRGWLLAGRVVGSSTTFNIISSNWATTTTFGSTYGYATGEDMKNNAWNYYSGNCMAVSFQTVVPPNTSNNWVTFTHNQNTTLNGIFSWDNVNNGYLSFTEQFSTSGSYSTALNTWLDHCGPAVPTRGGSPTGRLGLNVFMTSGSGGVRRNANQMVDGAAGYSGGRIGFLGDNTATGTTWPGIDGGPDDYFLGIAGQHCNDGYDCNKMGSSTVAGSWRLGPAGAATTWFSTAHIWIK